MEVQLSSILMKKIMSKSCTVCIVGLGQVGLPTALAFLNAGFRVLGFDINEQLVKGIQDGKSHIPEKGFNELIKKFTKDESFVVTTNSEMISTADIIISCVATPLEPSTRVADMSFLEQAIRNIANNLTTEKLIVIESTVPPLTMKEFIIPMIEKLSRKSVGKHFLISFCPERIAPGNALEEFAKNSRIIGANDDASYDATLALFKHVSTGALQRADTTAAEMAKLAENTYRDTNIALANELAIICEQSATDVAEVIRLANTHPRVNIHQPGPGVGGPCLPKDPYLLIAKEHIEHSLVRTARTINDLMPGHVVDVITHYIESNGRSKQSSFGVLGVSYKPNVEDTRYSPTKGIIIALKEKGYVDLCVHDPYTSDSFGARYNPDLSSILIDSDCVIIATAHTVYSTLKSEQFKKGSIIMDSVRILNRNDFKSKDITYLALGA